MLNKRRLDVIAVLKHLNTILGYVLLITDDIFSSHVLNYRSVTVKRESLIILASLILHRDIHRVASSISFVYLLLCGLVTIFRTS